MLGVVYFWFFGYFLSILSLVFAFWYSCMVECILGLILGCFVGLWLL